MCIINANAIAGGTGKNLEILCVPEGVIYVSTLTNICRC